MKAPDLFRDPSQNEADEFKRLVWTRQKEGLLAFIDDEDRPPVPIIAWGSIFKSLSEEGQTWVRAVMEDRPKPDYSNIKLL